MKQQQLMFSGMQETLKKQSDVFLSAIQQLTAGMSNSPGAKEARLPSQPGENPKGHCGAITAVGAVTTRGENQLKPFCESQLLPHMLPQPKDQLKQLKIRQWCNSQCNLNQQAILELQCQ